MGTEWQLELHSTQSPVSLRSIAEAVVEEVERVEQQLSFYRETSDLRSLNATAAYEDTAVDPRLFSLLGRVQTLSRATGGAIDPTVGPLLRCWGFVGGSGSMPIAEEIEAARRVVGMEHVILTPGQNTVRFDREGIELEFGAVGKGYAIERAVDMLRDEYEIESALLHGGTSTIYGLGAPPGEDAWNVAIRRPNSATGETVLTLPLRDRAVSVSAPHGKWFEQEGNRYGHVLDPRTGNPAVGSVIAVVATATAMESDALSTALLVMGETGMATVRALRQDAFVLVGIWEESGELRVAQDGPLSAGNL